MIDAASIMIQGFVFGLFTFLFAILARFFYKRDNPIWLIFVSLLVIFVVLDFLPFINLSWGLFGAWGKSATELAEMISNSVYVYVEYVLSLCGGLFFGALPKLLGID
jgi:phosphotransferase system  glucose/maltose/N-acetylglucosamine-specific IIC component